MACGSDVRDVDKEFGQHRLAAARAFMRQAEQSEVSATNEYELAAALSSVILAAIAAADAICALRLSQVWKGGHFQVHSLLRQVRGADQAATALQRVVSQKTDVQYLTRSVTRSKLTTAMRQAQTVIAFAERVASNE